MRVFVPFSDEMLSRFNELHAAGVNALVPYPIDYLPEADPVIVDELGLHDLDPPVPAPAADEDPPRGAA